MSRELVLKPLHELSSLLQKGEISSEELVRATIERTEALEPELHTYITFLPEQALEQARRCDEERRRGEPRSPLHGVPVSLKDVFATAGIPTSAGAGFLREHVPEGDAEVTRRLREAGTVLMGKANLTRFTEGESGENDDFGHMKNPWNTDFSASGSSGGSAAQVATGLVALSVGSDNGGSIRNPASTCGVVGLKPTHGRISTDGMFPRIYTIDHAGPLTRTVTDAAMALQVLAGHRAGDDTARRREVPDYVASLGEPVGGMTLGIDRGYLRVAERQVLSVFESALAELSKLGCAIEEVSLPGPEEMLAVMYPIFFCEYGAAHEPWLREYPEEYGGGSRAALLVPAVQYLDAQRNRRLLQHRFAEGMKDVDLLVSPTYPIRRRPFGPLPRIGGRRISPNGVLRFTLSFDLMGLPAISIPGGFSDDGSPVGIQLAGRAWEEPRVLQAAHAYEQATGRYRQHPPI